MSEDPAALIARAAGGDKEAWRSLYLLHAPAIRRALCAFASLGPADIEDLVQETFVQAFRSLGQLREPAAFRPWTLRIARGVALRRLSRTQTEAKTRAALARDPTTTHEDSMRDHIGRERRIAIVRGLIDGLPEGPTKETIRLFYLEGQLSAREIAEQLGVGKSTVTMRLERFRAQVKKRLAVELDGALEPTP
ncbi:MAG: sigma-70 family RNA polymerase sigma factor [Myxococcota bacterium]